MKLSLLMDFFFFSQIIIVDNILILQIVLTVYLAASTNSWRKFSICPLPVLLAG